jgi:hypothetical protein
VNKSENMRVDVFISCVLVVAGSCFSEALPVRTTRVSLASPSAMLDTDTVQYCTRVSGSEVSEMKWTG